MKINTRQMQVCSCSLITVTEHLRIFKISHHVRYDVVHTTVRERERERERK